MIIRLVLTAAAAIAAVSCGKDTGNDNNSLIGGEWKLTEVGGVPASDLLQDEHGGLDVYLAFNADGTFETFQRLGSSLRYVRYSGTYRVNGTVATGTYEDGTPWGAEYGVGVVSGADGSTVLVMTGNGEDCRYSSTAVPESVRANAVAPFAFKSGEGGDLPPYFL